MKISFKLITLLIIFALGSISVKAQGTLDKLKFEEAEQKYLKGDYNGALWLIKELEDNGLKNPTVLYLKIMAMSKIDVMLLDDKLLIQFKKDVDYYLKNYDIDGLEDKNKEVYEVSKTLSDSKYDEGFFCYNKGCNMYTLLKKESEPQNIAGNKEALEWFLKAVSYGYKEPKLYYFLGCIYEYGSYGDDVKDINKAIEWYTKAAQQGNKQAQDALTKLGKTW